MLACIAFIGMNFPAGLGILGSPSDRLLTYDIGVSTGFFTSEKSRSGLVLTGSGKALS